MAKLIAVAGKGGVGKTTVSALLVRYLIEKKKGPILAVDADPNSNFNEVLGLRVEQTIGAVREKMSTEVPTGWAKHDYLAYKIEECLVESSGFDLLVMGRPEGPGCYCFANNVLRDVIKQITNQYPYLVIDNEAGMEHLSRRVTMSIDRLFLVTDPTVRGLEAAEKIAQLTKELKLNVGKIYLVVNRLVNGLPPSISERIRANGLELVGTIPEEPLVGEYDSLGKPTFELPADCQVVKQVNEIASKVEL